MNASATLFVLMAGVPSASMHGAAKTEDQPAIVVSVENHDPQSNSNYAGPLDLPLQPQSYSYDVNLGDHVIYVTLPGEGAVRMPIESRSGL
jgi:hypothetical protein